MPVHMTVPLTVPFLARRAKALPDSLRETGACRLGAPLTMGGQRGQTHRAAPAKLRCGLESEELRQMTRE